MTLLVVAPDGRRVALPATADARQGGFVVDTSGLNVDATAHGLRGVLQGYWGFDRYDGPEFDLEDAQAGSWHLAPGEPGSLIVGREEIVRLQGRGVHCIRSISLQDRNGHALQAQWKVTASDEIESRWPLQDTPPGSMTLRIEQYGVDEAEPIPLEAYSEAAHFDGFTLHAGDAQGVLKGTRLDQVTSLTLKGVRFLPGPRLSAQGSDPLSLIASDPSALAQLKPGEWVQGKVALQDGRLMDLGVTPLVPRPRTLLMAKAQQLPPSAQPSPIHLANNDELPQGAALTFSIRALSPAVFTAVDRIEVATADRAYATVLSTSDGAITLQDAQVMVARIDPARALGLAAFGPLQYRLVTPVASSDWQALVTLVRVPLLEDLECPATPDTACKLTGTQLFLLESVSNDPQFAHPVEIPDGFPGNSLPVPHPDGGQWYLKLRDDPAFVHSVTLLARPPPAAALAPGVPPDTTVSPARPQIDQQDAN